VRRGLRRRRRAARQHQTSRVGRGQRRRRCSAIRRYVEPLAGGHPSADVVESA
jgi:hypothetical protein